MQNAIHSSCILSAASQRSSCIVVESILVLVATREDATRPIVHINLCDGSDGLLLLLNELFGSKHPAYTVLYRYAKKKDEKWVGRERTAVAL